MEMSRARLVVLIHTTLLRRGEGQTSDDPIRIIEQWWTLDGELVVEKDEWKERYETKKHIPTP